MHLTNMTPLVTVIFSLIITSSLCAVISPSLQETVLINFQGDHDPRSNVDERGIGVEGDMIFSPSLLSGVKDTRLRWPNATIVYKIDETFTTRERSVIRDGMLDISSKTCIKFQQQTNEKDYVFVLRAQSRGCSSHVGRIGGKQDLNLQVPSCIIKGVISHEFIHAIGFRHEHSRSDRDDFLSIKYSNIQPRFLGAFNKYGPDEVSTFGVPFDYGSIMLYSMYAFSNGKDPTIIPKKSGVKIGQRNALSEYDAKKINNMYNC